LNEGEPEIVIHGLGAAVPRAVNLALQLKAKHMGTVEVAVNTSTVDIIGWYV
jgi:ribonuclease P/MRP protein subunit RPP20